MNGDRGLAPRSSLAFPIALASLPSIFVSSRTRTTTPAVVLILNHDLYRLSGDLSVCRNSDCLFDQIGFASLKLF